MWKVLTWSVATQSGTIAGPHLGPLPFDQTTTSVRDFVPGEEVAVELEGTGPSLRVRSLSPLHARQPPGTESTAFLELNAREFWDFSVPSLEVDVLTIIGGNDLSYSHAVEIVFSEVTFISLPTYFSHALFRLASREEVSALRDRNEIEGTVFCIVAEHGNGSDGPKHFVAASRVECRFGTVFHYRRENLQPGERIAPWVK